MRIRENHKTNKTANSKTNKRNIIMRIIITKIAKKL